jgi:NAD(P) transhydrogenase subunit alpha
MLGGSAQRIGPLIATFSPHAGRRRRTETFMVTLSILAQVNTMAAAMPEPAAVGGEIVNPFVFRLSIFVLAVFVGYYVVWSVTPALHTPLMSVTNAISSVIVVGALLAVGVALAANDSGPIWARALGFVALMFASVNIFGGFLVTQRMLSMFHRKDKR